MKKIGLLVLFIFIATSYGNSQTVVMLKLPKNCALKTGVEVSQSNDAKLELFPNPNDGKFVLNVKFDTPIEKAIIKIYNGMGQNIYSEEISSDLDSYVAQLNLRKITQGIYFLRIEKGVQYISTKLIIK
jgi:hypothetical protein